MARLAYRKDGLRPEDLEMHRRVFHEADGTVVEGKSCAFRERFAVSVAERILKDWDRFVYVAESEDGDWASACINIEEKRK